MPKSVVVRRNCDECSFNPMDTSFCMNECGQGIESVGSMTAASVLLQRVDANGLVASCKYIGVELLPDVLPANSELSIKDVSTGAVEVISGPTGSVEAPFSLEG